jgi:hypothetical protein
MKEESKDLRNKDRRESDLKGARKPLSSEEIAEVTAEIRF